MTLERFYLRAGGVVIFIHLEVIATSHEDALIRMQRRRVDIRRHRVFADRFQAVGRQERDGLVMRNGDHGAIARYFNTRRIGSEFDLLDLRAAGAVPDPHGFIVGAREQALVVPEEHHMFYSSGVSGKSISI